MIISPGRAYVFVHIPKTGGTSMALALEARAKADDILVGDTPKARRRRHRLTSLNAPGRLWKHARLADIDGMAGLPADPFVFTLVRNPWDRMASLYHWAQAQSFEHPMIRAAKALDFEGFLTDRRVEAALRRDGAAVYVTDRAGRARCDAFIRLEHLADDLGPLEEHLGFRLEIPHANRSNRPRAAELYTDRTRAHVAEIFAGDVSRFGYSFPG